MVNGLGEFYFTIEADPASGVIDMFAGRNDDEIPIFPARVVALGPKRTVLHVVTRSPGPAVSVARAGQEHARTPRTLETRDSELAVVRIIIRDDAVD